MEKSLHVNRHSKYALSFETNLSAAALRPGNRRRHHHPSLAKTKQLFPSAVKFHDFLTGLAGDREESPAGDMSAIPQPFMIEVRPQTRRMFCFFSFSPRQVGFGRASAADSTNHDTIVVCFATGACVVRVVRYSCWSCRPFVEGGVCHRGAGRSYFSRSSVCTEALLVGHTIQLTLRVKLRLQCGSSGGG